MAQKTRSTVPETSALETIPALRNRRMPVHTVGFGKSSSRTMWS